MREGFIASQNAIFLHGARAGEGVDIQVQKNIENRWGPDFNQFESPQKFLSSPAPHGVIAVGLGRASLCMLGKNKRSKNLIVFFSHAAQRSPERLPPFFYGIDTTSELDASLLAIDDPALQYRDDLNLGWHVGAHDMPLQKILPSIINHVAASYGAQNIFLVGGSGGGFAALYFGTIIPSTVFVVNPQTDVLRYNRTHFERYAEVCFSWDGVEPIKSCFGDAITDLPLLYKRGARASGLYMQNASDWHVGKHAIPLMRALGGQDEPIDQHIHGMDFVFRDWGVGHASLPKDGYVHVLRGLLDQQPVEDIISSYFSSEDNLASNPAATNAQSSSYRTP